MIANEPRLPFMINDVSVYRDNNERPSLLCEGFSFICEVIR